MNPDISIILCAHIPSMDYVNLLKRSILSLEAQTLQNFELILVLDECIPESICPIKEYTDILPFPVHVYERDKKCGHGAAINYGIERANCELICLLDADDEYTKTKIETQYKWMLDHPQTDFCFTGCYERVGDRVFPGYYGVDEYLTHPQIYKALPVECIVTSSTVMFRRASLDSIGGFLEMNICSDYHTYLKARDAGLRFAKIAEFLYIYTMDTSVSK